MKIGLVACSATKDTLRRPARELYQGALFRKSSAYAEAAYDRWFVLSARYALLDPDRWIGPYEASLATLTKRQRDLWAVAVVGGLKNELGIIDRHSFYLHAGALYRRDLMDRLPHATAPLAGLRIGEQLAWYGARTS